MRHAKTVLWSSDQFLPACSQHYCQSAIPLAMLAAALISMELETSLYLQAEDSQR
jgi:hypothetical protein